MCECVNDGVKVEVKVGVKMDNTFGIPSFVLFNFLFYSPFNFLLISQDSRINEFFQLSTRLGHVYAVEDFVDHLFASDVFGFCLVGQTHTVAQHVHGNGANILGNDITTAAHEGVGLGG